jgi:hypothetical protein
MPWLMGVGCNKFWYTCTCMYQSYGLELKWVRITYWRFWFWLFAILNNFSVNNYDGGQLLLVEEKTQIYYTMLWEETTVLPQVNWQTVSHSHVGPSRIWTDAGWRGEVSWYEIDVLTTWPRMSLWFWLDQVNRLNINCWRFTFWLDEINRDTNVSKIRIRVPKWRNNFILSNTPWGAWFS